MKKLLSIIIAILMIVTTVPMAFAADDYAVVDTEAGTVTIDGTLGGKTEATEEDLNAMVEILKNCVESGITTVIVTGSQPAKLLKDGYLTPLTSLVFEQMTYDYTDENEDRYWGTIDLIYQDVTEIVEWEFYVCDVLKSITLPKVTTVGGYAFWALYYLETLTFGSVVTDISYQSFEVFYDLGYEIGGCNLVLNCGQLDAEFDYQPNLEDNTWWSHGSTGEWKSITLTHNGGEATCIAKAVCETCGEEYGEFDANKHTLVQKDAKAPTCTEIGWDAYESCTECDYTTYEVLLADPDAHTPLEAVTENEVAPKCDVAGSYDLVVYCDDCGAELDRDTKTVDALKHSFTKYEVTEEAKCGIAGKKVATCDNGCGATDEKAIEALKHSLVLIKTTPAKCGEPMVEFYDCEFCCNCEVARPKFGTELFHSFTKYEITEAPTCNKAGEKAAPCDNGCGEIDVQTVPALDDHVDADGDYKCDFGCGHEFEKPAPEEPTPDTPDAPTDDSEACPDCGRPVHDDSFAQNLICLILMLINLIKTMF